MATKARRNHHKKSKDCIAWLQFFVSCVGQYQPDNKTIHFTFMFHKIECLPTNVWRKGIFQWSIHWNFPVLCYLAGSLFTCPNTKGKAWRLSGFQTIWIIQLSNTTFKSDWISYICFILWFNFSFGLKVSTCLISFYPVFWIQHSHRNEN